MIADICGNRRREGVEATRRDTMKISRAHGASVLETGGIARMMGRETAVVVMTILVVITMMADFSWMPGIPRVSLARAESEIQNPELSRTVTADEVAAAQHNRDKLFLTSIADHLKMYPATDNTNGKVLISCEQPGVMKTTAKFAYSTIETFDSRPLGINEKLIIRSKPSRDGLREPQITSVYSNLNVTGTDAYGGLGKLGHYATVTNGNHFTVDYSTEGARDDADRGLNYFGFWISSLDQGNFVEIFLDDKLLFRLTPQQVFELTTAPEYRGNPNFKPRLNAMEQFAFLNIFCNGCSFNRVEFHQVEPIASFETDNHTVGYATEVNGVPLVEQPQNPNQRAESQDESPREPEEGPAPVDTDDSATGSSFQPKSIVIAAAAGATALGAAAYAFVVRGTAAPPPDLVAEFSDELSRTPEADFLSSLLLYDKRWSGGTQTFSLILLGLAAIWLTDLRGLVL